MANESEQPASPGRRDSPEKIILSVQGMDCSTCGDKLGRALRAIPGVTHVNVNFLVASADFYLDESIISEAEAIQSAEKASGFRCIRHGGEAQYIDLLLSREAARRVTDANIRGVRDVYSLSKTAARVTYDPLIIGARALVHEMGNISLGLAPSRSSHLQISREQLRLQIKKVIAAAVLTMPVVVLAWGDTMVEASTKATVSIALATAVQIIAIPEFYSPALKSLVRNRNLDMDMLVVISITAAYVYSTVAFGFRVGGQPLATPELFETSSLLITLVLLGRLIAVYVRSRAVEAVSVRTLQSSTAVLVEGQGDTDIDTRLLQYGDKFRLLPETKVPTDGIVISGSSEVDESMLTGEALPVPKIIGKKVVAGTVNKHGTLVAKVTRLPGKNTLTEIASLVDEASNSKLKLRSLADRVGGYFVPAVSSCALVVFVVWILVGIKLRNEMTGPAVATAVTYSVGVLAVSCPCALGLAVPMVLVGACGIAARRGVVIKAGEAAERARKVTDVVLDKTGTLTEEMFVVSSRSSASISEEGLAITKALVQGIRHPVSAAVSEHLSTQAITPADITEPCAIAGGGIIAVLGTSVVKAGSPRWTMTESDPGISRALTDGNSVLSVTQDDNLLAAFFLQAKIRPDAFKVIENLSSRNITIHLVSGDQTRTVEAVAAQVGITSPNIASRCSPRDKKDYVSALMKQGKTVLFCGDGTNDAAAVAQADVGVLMGAELSSSDVTRAAADVVLLAGLDGLPLLLDISRSAYKRIMFNFAWAMVYNVFAILLTAGVFVHARIPPAYAGLGEIVSVVPVILVGLTMLWRKKPPVNPDAQQGAQEDIQEDAQEDAQGERE